MFVLKIENTKGEIFELTHNTQNYVISGISGLTPADTTVNTSEGTADGGEYNSSRVQMRNIVIDIDLKGDIEVNRQRLYQIFPQKTVCTVYFRNRNRNVKISGYVEVLNGDLFVQQEQIQISIICPKPYFEAIDTLYTELSSVVKLFEFPFSIGVNEPIPFSERRNLSLCTIMNNGDIASGFILTISIISEVNHLNIYNIATQQYFGLDYDFQEDDILTINTKSGKEKGVSVFRDGETINLLSRMTAGSSWIQLAVGANDLTFTASDQDALKILIASTELYGGV